MEDILIKFNNLKKIVSNLNRPAIAFSGGVDSTFLARVLKDVHKSNFLAITAVSKIFPDNEIKDAVEWLSNQGIDYITLEYEPLEIEEFVNNPPDRCYFCKLNLFSKLKDTAAKHGCTSILDGTNYDDIKDYRPGLKALEELNVLSPLKKAMLTKEEIRYLSKNIYNLPTYNKITTTCLATRIPYYSKITLHKLEQLNSFENKMREMGFKVFRARHHDDILRIELRLNEYEKMLNPGIREKIVEKGIELGFKYITLDLEPYVSGNLYRKLNQK